MKQNLKKGSAQSCIALSVCADDPVMICLRAIHSNIVKDKGTLSIGNQLEPNAIVISSLLCIHILYL